MLCLMLIQSRIVWRHELPALGCTRRLGKAETPSPSTPRCCIEEICDQRATKILIETRTGFSVITLARSSLGESSGCLGAQTAARKAHPLPSLRQGRGCCSPFVQVGRLHNVVDFGLHAVPLVVAGRAGLGEVVEAPVCLDRDEAEE